MAFFQVTLNKQLLALVVAAVVPLSVAGLSATYLLYQAYDETAAARLQRFTSTVLDSIELRAEAARAAAHVLALSEELQRDDFDAFRRKSEMFLSLHYPTSAVVVTDRDGQQRVNTGLPAGTPLPNNGPGGPQKVYAQVFENGTPVISKGFLAPAVKRYVSTVNVPVWRDGRVAYNLALPLTSEYLSSSLSQLAGPDTLIALFDQDLKLLARSQDSGSHVGRDPSPTLRPLLEAREDAVVVTTTFDGKRVLTSVATSNLLGWKVAVGVSESVVKQPFARAVFFIAAFGAVSLLLGALAAYRLARHVIRENKHRDMLLDELNHRVKNTLAIVQSLVSQTLRRKQGEEARQDIDGRLLALSHAHDVLTKQRWKNSSLALTLEYTLKPYQDLPAAITTTCDHCSLLPKQSLALSLVLHELATNAVKYGALGQAGGTIDITATAQDGVCQINWRERSPREVRSPEQHGFGSTLIRRITESDLGGNVSMGANDGGFDCVISFPLKS